MCVQDLEDASQEHSRRLDVSMRFVDWFTRRGDIYEGNLQVIDKHLKNLATSSAVPGSRMPYTSQVRYQPVSPVRDGSRPGGHVVDKPS